jgi:hypothetical protein
MWATLVSLGGIVLWWISNTRLREINRDEAYRDRDLSDASLRTGPLIDPVGQQPHGHEYDEGTI